MKLNLGCGDSKRKGYKNLDYPDIDLEKFPYPFDNDSVDEIILSHVLEHLWVKPIDVIRELHRILKPDGILVLKLPIRTNIIQHIRQEHSIYYMNYFLTNPIGVIAKRNTHTVISCKFYCEKLEKKRNISMMIFEKRLGGEQDTVQKIEKDVKKLLLYFPHKIYDLLFNGEIVWKLRKI